ncbi:hypothetical protein HAX54_036479, partial [Datura stramonium]|nr:hypothetical protein [Datura stramonium]
KMEWTKQEQGKNECTPCSCTKAVRAVTAYTCVTTGASAPTCPRYQPCDAVAVLLAMSGMRCRPSSA